MNRLFVLVCAIFLSFSMKAQMKDAATVYSEMQIQNNILKTFDPNSEDYRMAIQSMLRLYPQLQYHAVIFQQNGNMEDAVVFAQACVDMAMMSEFKALHLEKREGYTSMVYFVASNYYNRQDYASAARYLERFIECGEQKNRHTAYLFLAQAQSNLGQTEKLLNTLNFALAEYPTDKNLLIRAINIRMKNGWYEDAVKYIDVLLQETPEDNQLLLRKGQCLEGSGQYEEAADVFFRLHKQQKSLDIYKHYALNLFNCGVSYNSTDSALSRDFFLRSIPVFNQIVANDPTSVQYTTSLALAYLYTDQLDEMNAVNSRLRILGASEVDGGQETPDISLMASSLSQPSSAMPELAAPKVTPSVQISKTQPEKKVKSKFSIDYTSFSKDYIDKGISQWQQKNQFETIDEYTQRVNEETLNEKARELMNEAKQEFLAKYNQQVLRSDFSLKPYDAENGVFLINSKYGDIILPVPREQNQARQFANDWDNVNIDNTVLDIAGDELVIRSMDFVTPQGATYHYSDKDEAKYTQVDVNLQFNDINLAELKKDAANASRQKVNVQKQSITVGESDIDVDIPVTKNVRSKSFAFIIGNENYQMVSDVSFALNDAHSMQSYFHKTLGIPDDHILVFENATFAQILTCVSNIEKKAKTFGKDIDIIFYYAGHGIPDEGSKSAYLLPVDADGTMIDACYPIRILYDKLGQLDVNSVIVMMDACFSGSQRGEGMLASARSVALRVNAEEPQGKMVALSAATGEETAYPYEEKQHGMFSYFVMKYLKESKGRITLGNLADYVKTQVSQKSLLINNKSQTPTVQASEAAKEWRKWVLK